MQGGDVADVVGVFGFVGRIANAAALVAQAFFHRHPVVACVDELHLAFAVWLFVVGQHPYVGADAGVVKQLLGQRNHGFKPVVFDDPAANFGFAPARIACEQRRTVEHDADAAAALIGRAHLVDHVLQKQQCAVVDAWGARTKAAIETELARLVFDVALLLLPLHTKRRVGQHVIEAALLALLVAGVGILGEGVAQGDVVGIFAFDEHVGAADGPGLVVPVLAVQQWVGIAVEVADVFFGHRQHAARATGWVVDGFDNVAAAQVLLWCQQQIDHQFDDFARGEVLPGFFVGLLRPNPNQLLKHIAHLHGSLVCGQAGKAQVEGGELLDDLEQQVLFGHFGDLFTKLEMVEDGPDVGRVAVDVAVEVGGEVAGVVQQRVAPLL